MIPLDGDQPDASTAAPVRLYHDQFARLVYIGPHDKLHVGVRLHRLFPLTDPDGWISVQDERGDELASIPHVSQLANESRQTVETELARHEFAPTIVRVVSVSSKSEPSNWHVETNRGPTTFTLGNELDVRRYNQMGALIVDTMRIRYLIPDLRKLDLRSRRFLEWYV